MTYNKWEVNGLKQEKWMIEKFKEKILAKSEAVRCSQSAQSTIALLITSYDNSRKLSRALRFRKSFFYLLQWKRFKNNEKCFNFKI